MKTLIINGSPRKNGTTSTMVKMLAKKLDGEIMIVETYYDSIAPCYDCRYCWSHNKCAIDDKMQEIYEYINEADNIVIASPIYFGEVTGSLLNWASRLQYFWVAKYMKKTPALAEKQRKGIVLLADGGMRKMESALAMAKRLLNTMGAEFCQHIYYGGTDLEGTPPPDKDTETLQKISDIAKMLNEK